MAKANAHPITVQLPASSIFVAVTRCGLVSAAMAIAPGTIAAGARSFDAGLVQLFDEPSKRPETPRTSDDAVLLQLGTELQQLAARHEAATK